MGGNRGEPLLIITINNLYLHIEFSNLLTYRSTFYNLKNSASLEVIHAN